MRKTGLAASSFALAVTISSLLFAQPAPMPPPAPIMPPSLPPSHVVNLMTNEGSAVFGAQWRVGDVKIVEVPAAINKERYKTAYQFEPRAMATDFDDSKWETVEGKDLGARRSAGHVAFLWYRALLTMPAQVGSFDLSKPTQAVFNVLVDDYGEVWVNGQMPVTRGAREGDERLRQDARTRSAWCRTRRIQRQSPFRARRPARARTKR
jgi:gluconolactonase